MTSRKSKTIKIIDDTSYSRIKEEYLEVLASLSSKYSYNKDDVFSNLVNFKTNLSKSKHRWLNYKQGYASRLVEEILSRESNSLYKESIVLDPFCGVGTTNLVCQEHSINSVGYDINPVATTVAIAKTQGYLESDIRNIKEHLNKISNTTVINNIEIQVSDAKVLRSSFEIDTLKTLLQLSKYIEDLDNSKVEMFLKTVLISIIEGCSCRIKDGNGIKLAKNKNVRNDVIEYFLSEATSYLNDIEVNVSLADVDILEESYINSIDTKNYDLVIFSPPYANCFDYFEVYKLEMWVAGFAKKYEDFAQYRDIALRSHVNSKFSHSIHNENHNVSVVSELLATTNLWNKNIPTMIKGYFDDMTKVLNQIYERLNTDRRCYIVVANSGYRGILVPTDLLLIEIAEKIGFRLDELVFARQIRASSQQSEVLNGNYNNLMRESVIILRK